MHLQLRPFSVQLFLDFCVIFEWPLIFRGLHDSPSNLAESWYPRRYSNLKMRRSANNLAPKCFNLTAMNILFKVIYEKMILVSRPHQFFPFDRMPYAPTPTHFCDNYSSIYLSMKKLLQKSKGVVGWSVGVWAPRRPKLTQVLKLKVSLLSHLLRLLIIMLKNFESQLLVILLKNSREKWRKWISLTGSPRWPSASANHRQTGWGLHQWGWSDDACATQQRRPRHELAWIWTDF